MFYENETKFGTNPAILVCLRSIITKPGHFTYMQRAPACKKILPVQTFTTPAALNAIQYWRHLSLDYILTVHYTKF